jgi:CRP/FNR family transcriptional regulator
MLERVALAILINLEAFGYDGEDGRTNVLGLTLSRADYSSLTGTTYETIIRMLAELERIELISLENKEIRILDEKGLRRLIADASNKPVRKTKIKT